MPSMQRMNCAKRARFPDRGDAIVQDGGFLCKCGARNEVDIERFAEEIKKSESAIKDFGRQG